VDLSLIVVLPLQLLGLLSLDGLAVDVQNVPFFVASDQKLIGGSFGSGEGYGFAERLDVVELEAEEGEEDLLIETGHGDWSVLGVLVGLL
jgi:hypothetical protein